MCYAWTFENFYFGSCRNEEKPGVWGESESCHRCFEIKMCDYYFFREIDEKCKTINVNGN